MADASFRGRPTLSIEHIRCFREVNRTTKGADGDVPRQLHRVDEEGAEKGEGFSFRIVPLWSAIRPLAVLTHSTFRLDPDAIIDGVANPLLTAKISLGRLNRHV